MIDTNIFSLAKLLKVKDPLPPKGHGCIAAGSHGCQPIFAGWKDCCSPDDYCYNVTMPYKKPGRCDPIKQVR